MAGFKMKNLFKLKDLSFKSQDLLLTLVFVIYLISNAKIPLMLEKMIDTTSGNIAIIILALIVMVKFNPVVGVLGLLVAYELMRRSSISNSNILLRQEVPSEKSKKHLISSRTVVIIVQLRVNFSIILIYYYSTIWNNIIKSNFVSYKLYFNFMIIIRLN